MFRSSIVRPRATAKISVGDRLAPLDALLTGYNPSTRGLGSPLPCHSSEKTVYSFLPAMATLEPWASNFHAPKRDPFRSSFSSVHIILSVSQYTGRTALLNPLSKTDRAAPVIDAAAMTLRKPRQR